MRRIKSGDSGIVVRLNLKRLDGTAYDLSGASVSFIMASGSTKITKTCTVDNAPAGKCYCTLSSQDTATPGVYSVEAKITKSGNTFTTITDARLAIVKSL